MRLKPLLLCICLLLFTGCTGSGAKQEAPPQIKIGLTLYRRDDTFISLVRNEIENAAREREVQDNIKITVNVTDGRGNQSNQNDQVNKFLSQGYDVICVNEVDRTAASVIIDKARAADIPIVFFNREPVEEDLRRWEKVYYVGSDPEESGTLQGEIVADMYMKAPGEIDRNGDGKLQYVMLEGEPGHQDAAVRTEYCIKALTDRGIRVEKLANGIANWQRAQGASKMALWITEYGSDIEVVFSNNDDMALGAIDAYKAAGIEVLPPIVGIDATPPAVEAVKAGMLAGTVLNDATGQGQAIFNLAYALATGKDAGESGVGLEGQYVWIQHSVVTRSSEQ